MTSNHEEERHLKYGPNSMGHSMSRHGNLSEVFNSCGYPNSLHAKHPRSDLQIS